MLPPQVGTVIFGRYRLRREIARGGMSTVWEGEDRKLRRAVAVKILLTASAKSRGDSARFEREAMAVAQLQSPHIVQIFDYGVERECPFIVMELLEGEDLRTRLRRVGRMGLEELLPIVVQTAKGLGAAHSAGLVHRDLKPGNIFLVRSRDEELVKLLDFGVAKATTGSDLEQETTKDGAILGTPRYMSPEQALGSRSLDQRSDLWSLAVIVFRALTGKPPYTGKTPADVVVRVCTQPAPKPTAIAPDLPPALDSFFDRALRQDPEERFESARDFVKALRDVSPVSFPSLELPAPHTVPSQSPNTIRRGFPREKPAVLPPRARRPDAIVFPSVSKTTDGKEHPATAADPDDVATLSVPQEQVVAGEAQDDEQTFLDVEPAEDGSEEPPTEVDSHDSASTAGPGPTTRRQRALLPPLAAERTAGDRPPASRRSWAWLVAAGVVLGVLVAVLARLAPSGGNGGGAPLPQPSEGQRAPGAATSGLGGQPPSPELQQPGELPTRPTGSERSAAGGLERSAAATAEAPTEQPNSGPHVTREGVEPPSTTARSTAAVVDAPPPAASRAPAPPPPPSPPAPTSTPDPFADRH